MFYYALFLFALTIMWAGQVCASKDQVRHFACTHYRSHGQRQPHEHGTILNMPLHAIIALREYIANRDSALGSCPLYQPNLPVAE